MFLDTTTHFCVKCKLKCCNGCSENADDNDLRHHRRVCPKSKSDFDKLDAVEKQLMFANTNSTCEYDQIRIKNIKERAELYKRLNLENATKNTKSKHNYTNDSNSESNTENNSENEFSFVKTAKNVDNDLQKRLLGLYSSPEKELEKDQPTAAANARGRGK